MTRLSNRADRAYTAPKPRRVVTAPTAPNRACPSRDGAEVGAPPVAHRRTQPRRNQTVLANTPHDRSSSPPMASPYTDTQKADAVQAYVAHGLAEAHRRTGIPKPSLQRWAEAAGHNLAELAGRSTEKTRAATEAHIRSMREQRVKAQAEFARSAVYAAQQVRQSDTGKDAHGWAMASGTMLDKLRLELGEVTDRTELVEAPDRTPDVEGELAKLYDLAEHRAA